MFYGLGSLEDRSAMRIERASEADLDVIMQVHREAFAREDEALLVAALLRDPTAQPATSLLAYEGDRAIGHVLFTKMVISDSPFDVSSAILAPLAVVPSFQRKGVGRALIEHGTRLLASTGVKYVFVLGEPGYYTRFGFLPAIPHGLHAPYQIVPEEAWMVRSLVPNFLGTVSGRVVCASSLAKPEYWRE